MAGVTAAYYGGRPVYNTTDIEAYAREGYMANPDVFAAVDLLATSGSGVGWKVIVDTKSGDEKEITSGPLVDLLRRPNPQQSWTQFVDEWIRWRAIGGGAYVSAAGPKNGAPRELWILKSHRMRVVPGPTAASPVAGYEYRVGGRVETLPAEQVLYSPKFHPTDDWYGFSPLQAAAKLIDQAAAAGDWNLGTLQNGGIPPGFLMTDDELTDEQFEDLDKQIATWSEAARAGRPRLLEAGLKYETSARTPAEMQFLEAQRMFALKFAQVLRVPAELLSGAGEKKYANYGEARKALYLEATLPELDVLVDELARFLDPWFGGQRLVYDKDDIEALQEDRDALHKRAVSSWRGGVAMRNESRGMIGLPPVKDGDVFIEQVAASPGGGLGAGSLGTAEVPGAGNGGQQAEPETDPAVPEPEPADPNEKATGPDVRKDARADVRSEHWKATEAGRAAVEGKATDIVAGVFDAERQRVGKALANAAGPASAYTAVDVALRAGAADWKAALGTVYLTVAEPFADAALARAKANAGPNRVKASGWREYVQSYVKRVAGAKVQQITSTTRDQIRSVIDTALASDAGMVEVQRQVDKLYLDEITPNRSRVIARTETAAASNAGTMAVARTSGVATSKEWVAQGDDRTRETHAAMDGTSVPLDHMFEVGGSELDFPGDSDHGATADEVVQCRCTFLEGYD